jgi:Tol biopolymer transport system component
MLPAGAEELQARAALIQTQLETIRGSAEFRQSARMRRFLGFVVECAMRGETDHLKETVIGVEVFDRPPGYDPKLEPIVRTEAHRLREKLRKYYQFEGADSAVTISLPKGGYAPLFEFRPVVVRHNPEVISFPAPELVERPAGARSRGPLWLFLCAAAACIAALVVLWPSRKPGPALSLSPLTSFTGNAFCPSLAPDGQRAAFVWDGGGSGNFDIYVKQVNLGDALRLTTDPAQDLDPAWSPDGQQIAFLRRSPDHQELMVIPAMGGAERKIADISARQTPWIVDASSYVRHLGPAWSPDGAQIAVADSPGAGEPDSIYLFNVETGERRRLTTPVRLDEADSQPVFSFRGDRLAFLRWRTGAGGSPAIYLQATKGGEPSQLAVEHRQLAGIAWSADDRRIIFSSDRDDEYKLWEVPLSGGQPVIVGGGVGIRGQHPSVSSDGRRLAYTERVYSTNIWRAPVDPGAADRPAPLLSSSRSDDSPQYSPDGRRLLFISNRLGPRQIWTSDADGSRARPLASLRGALPGTPRWSPDGARILFDSKHEGFGAIYVMDADGSRPWRLTPPQSSSMMASWSHDAKWVYYASDRSGEWQIWKQPMPEGNPVQVTLHGGLEAKESRDGRLLYYTKDVAGNRGRLWQIPVEGGAETPVDGLQDSNLGRQWSPADTGIYFVLRTPATAENGMFFFDFAAHRARRLFSLANRPVPGTSGPSVSPDGHWLLYSQVDRQASNIMLLQNFR